MVVADAHLPLPEASAVAESHLPQREAWAVVESHLPQREAWAVVELPALAESAIAAELPIAVELEVEEQAPQASRDSDSLFRQPLLLSFFVLNVSR